VTLPDAYFDEMYAAAPDPWRLGVRWYERRKYALTLAALDRPRYPRALEVGCSVGVLTERLADRCGALLAVDVAASAVELARARTAVHPHVTVERRRVPAEWPDGGFDLVLLSEVLYYLGDGDLDRTLHRAAGALNPGGTLLAVHWRHEVADYPQRGDAVHEALAAVPDLVRVVAHREPDYLLDLYVRAATGTDPATLGPAHREGLA
jgi:SAM-dependent methyltransferase